VLDIPELQEINIKPDGTMLIGAAVTLTRLALTSKCSHPLLSDVIEQVASPQIRNMATLGGNLIQAKRCWFYRNDFPCYKRHGGLSPCYAITGDHRFYHTVIGGHRCQAVTPSDLATALVALQAVAVVTGPGGRRDVPMESFYVGPGETVLRAGELLEGVRVPPMPARQRSGYEKLCLWQGDFAIASAAISATIECGRWYNICIVLGGIAPMPWRARKTESRLEGKIVSTELIHAELDRELNECAQPLPNNGWKLDAVVGLAENVAERLNDGT